MAELVARISLSFDNAYWDYLNEIFSQLSEALGAGIGFDHHDHGAGIVVPLASHFIARAFARNFEVGAGKKET